MGMEVVVPSEIESRGPAVIAFYLSMLEKGESPRLAEMLALRQPPQCMTDDVFLSGIGSLDQQIKDPRHLNHVVKSAMRNGYRPKHTDYYNAALARFPGDPQAFLNHGQARGHVKDVCEERGVSCEGGVTVKGREPEKDPYETPKHKLHPRIVKRNVAQRIKENPDLARKDRRELVEQVVAEHGPQN